MAGKDQRFASLPASDAGQKPAGQGGGLMAILLVSVLAAGLGGGAALFLPGLIGSGKPQEAAHAAPKAPEPEKPKDRLVLRELAPVVTNLAAPREIWIRLEGSVLLDVTGLEHPDAMVADISADTLGFLKTLSLADIEGAAGLRTLRADLEERASLRSEGRVRSVLIHALVVQ